MLKKNIWAIGIALMLTVFGAIACGGANEFTNPHNLETSDLAGVWIATYASGETDKLTINADGTFRQIFESARENYSFDSGWNQWTLEELPSGIFRLQLQGGRYFLTGVSFGETDGKIPCIGSDCTLEGVPYGYYDPFANEVVHMSGQLILIIKQDSNNRLILHHVWTSSDRGFLLFGGEKEIFYRK